ncbi:MAG: hypothetical protein HZB38_07040 [Planctomycetes bacterium]|nr:hypothetical protein [Planctomycetota bacterium]
MNWEINNRAKLDAAVARRSPHAAKQPLTDAEIEARRTELQQLARSSLAWRAFTYFVGYFACQVFWTALAVYTLTRGVADPTACLLTAAAYSGAAVPVLSRAGGASSPTTTPPMLNCKNCSA